MASAKFHKICEQKRLLGKVFELISFVHLFPVPSNPNNIFIMICVALKYMFEKDYTATKYNKIEARKKKKLSLCF